jgi:hypothetical protein
LANLFHRNASSVAGVDKPHCDLQIYEAKLPFGAVPALPDGPDKELGGFSGFTVCNGPPAFAGHGQFRSVPWGAARPFLTLPKHTMRSEQERICCRPVRRNELAKLYALARRNPQQVGATPDDIALNFVRTPVNISNLPHHFDSMLAAFIVENTIEPAGEMIEINRASGGFGGVTDQLRHGKIVESEVRFQKGTKLFSSGL